MFLWKEPTYHLIQTEENLQNLATKLQSAIDNNEPIAIDTETTGVMKKSALDCYHGWLLGISIAFKTDEGYYIPITHTQNHKLRKGQLNLKTIVDVLEPILSSGGLYVAHNGKFDYKFLWQAGIHLYPRFWDILLALKIINGDSKQPAGLKKVINQFVDIPHELVKSFSEAANDNAAEQEVTEFGIYAINDTIFTLFLYQALKPQIDKNYKKLFYEAEMPLIPILAQMELRGIQIDKEYYDKVLPPLNKCQRKIENSFVKKYGCNINSPAQVGSLLKSLAPLALQFDRSAKTQAIQTGIEQLQKIQRALDKKDKLYKIISHILFSRKINKTINTYVTKYPAVSHQHFVGGKVEYILHTTFSQIVNSGRLSSSPNVQNITKDDSLISVRRGFRARDGYTLIEADWSGCELRIVAVAGQDKIMVDAFTKNPRDVDLHAITAEKMNVTRFIGKTINFSIIYGATEWSISKTLNCSKEKSKEYLNMFFKTYPGIKKWKDQVEKEIAEKGYVSTFFGRRRYLSFGISPGMKGGRDDYKWSGAVRALVNHQIQGSSADILKFSMVKVSKELAKRNLDAHLLTTTHDSIVVEVREGLEEEVKQIMLGIMEVKLKGILLPVDVEIKKTFAKEKSK